MKSIYHFLGSVYFALILITTVAIFVVAGTFVESATQSHRYAALFTYESIFFVALLWGFFINILFAATRRWPFRLNHVPFLITHLGLLMILGGALTKHYFGVQGSMPIVEGSGSHHIIEPNTYAISMRGKQEKITQYYPIDNIKHPSIKLIGFYPHSTQRYGSWIKGSKLMINGLAPLPIGAKSQVRFFEGNSPAWDVYALRSENVEATIEKLYKQNARIVVTDRISGKILRDSPLDEELKFPDYIVVESIKIPLQGDKTLQNINTLTPYLGQGSVAVDIVRTPQFSVIEDANTNVHLVVFDSNGLLWRRSFANGGAESLIAYDDGFGGYAISADIPFSESPQGRRERESALTHLLEKQLRELPLEKGTLSPPLQLLWHACEATNLDFPSTLVRFLVRWSDTGGWLYPHTIPLPDDLEKVCSAIDWNSVSRNDRQGVLWSVMMFAQIDPLLRQGIPPLEVLHQVRWPLIESLRKEDSSTPFDLLTLLTQQLFSAAEALPNAPDQDDDVVPEIQAARLSAYLRAYEIHLSTIMKEPSEREMEDLLRIGKDLRLETSITPIYQPLPPEKKLEDNVPFVVLSVDGREYQVGYDRGLTGLKWPTLGGNYLVGFQPMVKEIPYHVRLREARQINYPDSTQAYSYEADVMISDRRTGVAVEKTISMNNVHETSDGYRFYLSSIATPSGEGAKRVQIIVNRDPAKYWMTYSGAIILSCGIVMLFGRRRLRFF
ncbi:MAG: hypothetical protein WCG42_01005 [Parachlamydiaceae bacterium]